MLGRLFLLFTITTTLELFLLIELGKLMGLASTLGLILLTGFIGAWLAKREGLKTLATIRSELGRGSMPGDSLLDGLAILIAGAFLLTPGVLTDGVGFLLLFPPTRLAMKRVAKARFAEMVRDGVASGSVHMFTHGPASAIDVQFGAPPPVRPTRESEFVEPRAIESEPGRVYGSGDVIDVTGS